MPLSNFVSVLKSSDPTNNTSFSFPAGATLIVTPTPVISTTVPESVGVCPMATLSCFNTPVPSKVPETLVKVTIPLFVVANFTTPVAELEAWDTTNLFVKLKVSEFFNVIVVSRKSEGDAVIAFPVKFNWVILFNVPTILPSWNILIEPGMTPPPIGTQNLSPGLSLTETIWNCGPTGTSGNRGSAGSPKFGSAWSNPSYWYLSVLK